VDQRRFSAETPLSESLIEVVARQGKTRGAKENEDHAKKGVADARDTTNLKGRGGSTISGGIGGSRKREI